MHHQYHFQYLFSVRIFVVRRKERKGKEVNSRPLSAQMSITQSYLQMHYICLSFI